MVINWFPRAVSDGKSVHHGDSWDLMQRRWSKLEKDFKTKKGQYDISKIPDIYDCIKYDLQHNHHQILFEHSEELYKCSKYLADVVIPQVSRECTDVGANSPVIEER